MTDGEHRAYTDNTYRWRRLESSSDMSTDDFHATSTWTTAQARRRDATLSTDYRTSVRPHIIRDCLLILVLLPAAATAAAAAVCCTHSTTSPFIQQAMSCVCVPAHGCNDRPRTALLHAARKPPSPASGHSGTARHGDLLHDTVPSLHRADMLIVEFLSRPVLIHISSKVQRLQNVFTASRFHKVV